MFLGLHKDTVYGPSSKEDHFSFSHDPSFMTTSENRKNSLLRTWTQVSLLVYNDWIALSHSLATEVLNTDHSGLMSPPLLGCHQSSPRGERFFSRVWQGTFPVHPHYTLGHAKSFHLTQITTRWWSVHSLAPLFRSDNTITKSIFSSSFQSIIFYRDVIYIYVYRPPHQPPPKLL